MSGAALPVHVTVAFPPRASSPPRSAADLTRAAAAGDADAFEEIYRTWFDRSVRIVAGLTGRDESFCLDVVQSAMLRAAKRIKPMASEVELQRWLLKVLRSCAIDHLRREARRARRERGVDGPREALVLEAERIEWIRHELTALGADESGLVLLRFGQDATLDQAGEGLGLTGDAAHGRLRRVFERMRKRWNKEFGHDE